MKSIVLLSGGLDSTAALIAEAARLRESAEAARLPESPPATLVALWFYYGQPAFQHEVRAAIRAADAVGAEFVRCDLQGVIHGTTSGLMAPQDHAVVAGRNTAFLPGRNALLLTAAAARAGTLWEGEAMTLTIGCNAEDAAGFPDCTSQFLSAMSVALQTGGLPVRIAAPWLDYSKREIFEWASARAVNFVGLLEASWSCYRAEGPCGKCTPCLARAAAGIPSPSGRP